MVQTEGSQTAKGGIHHQWCEAFVVRGEHQVAQRLLLMGQEREKACMLRAEKLGNIHKQGCKR